MENIFSWQFFCCALFFELCNGYSINLEDTISDQHTQLLTGIIGVLLTVCSLVFLIGCLCCHRRNDFKVFQNSQVVESVTTDTPDPGHINPVANGEFTIFTPLSPSHFNNNVFNEQIFTRNFENPIDSGQQNDVQNWFDDSEKNFPRIKLKYVKELGRGKYGKVVEGAAQCVANNGEMWTPVVIRILDSSSTKEERVKFFEDATLYKYGGHPNLLSLIGRCLETSPLLLIQEYCQGDLKSYLNGMVAETDSSATNYTLLWCSQLTSALKFLHTYQLVHPDIASRNCQLNSSMNLKLGDYGLAMYKYPGDYYQNIPIRWCDPESLYFENPILKLEKLTPQNNIWSLGVTLWEICECSQPYQDLTNEDVLQFINLNLKLNKPSRNSTWTNNIYQIMQMCWSDLEIRPHIVEIDLLVSQLQTYHSGQSTEDKVSASSIDFDKKWDMLCPNTTVNMDLSSDSVLVEMGDDYDVNTSKPLSPSLNNLHGSLDNLLRKCDRSDFPYNESVIRRSFDSDSISGTESLNGGKDIDIDTTHPFHNLNSGSETEDENWRDKVERGMYTEKVRVKSKSITDLMILTHVDYSESEPDTPFPSLTSKVNNKTSKNFISKFEFPYMSFGSEGNLSIQDTLPDKTKVNDEFKKFQEEYNNSQSASNNCDSRMEIIPAKKSYTSETDRSVLKDKANILCDLNIQPQIFNLYNVTIDNPLFVNNKLNGYINLNSMPNYEIVAKAEENRPVTLSTNFHLSDSNIESCDSNLGILTDNNVSENESRVFFASNADHNQIRNEKCIQGENEVERTRIVDRANITGIPGEFSEAAHAKGFEINECKSVTSNPCSVKSCEKEVNISQLACGNDFQLTANTSIDLNHIVKIGSSHCNLFQVPYLLHKPVSLKISLENMSSIKLFHIVIEPHQFESNIHSLITCESFIAKTLTVSRNESFLYHSGPESIIFYNENILNGKECSMYEQTQDEQLNYSLETWCDFLEKSLDEQKQNDAMFDSFSNEPKSMIFLNGEDLVDKDHESELLRHTSTPIKATLEEECEKPDSLEGDFGYGNDSDSSNIENLTFTKEESDLLHTNDEDSDAEGWEKNEGWYLHPQTKGDPSGELELGSSSSSSSSYVGFGVDDELMSAVRDELIRKLPHAQGACSEQLLDDNDWDLQERDEVFLRYNVYNAPLMPIPEESLNGDDSDSDTPKGQFEEDSDWSTRCDAPQDTESHSSHTMEIIKHCHTLSESSCCSNDTLFNLEELNSAPVEIDKKLDCPTFADRKIIEIDKFNNVPDVSNTDISNILNTTFVIESDSPEINNTVPSIQKNSNKFLLHERVHNETDVKCDQVNDKSCNDIIHPDTSKQSNQLKDYSTTSTEEIIALDITSSLDKLKSTVPTQDWEESETFREKYDEDNYDTLNIDYSQYVNMENAKNSLEYDESRKETEALNIIEKNINNDDDNVYGMLADIRFSGPTDSQLMSTSFSESNTCDEKEWDSGSDSRSSSSGEFIWKEGEREESLKALRTIHSDLEDVKSNDYIENSFAESDISSTFSDDEDRETPEFVPSAWDKFAIPIKSALRSPQKTLNKTGNKKTKVWFKKQKYHCIYEYPKEPESPVFQKEIRWQNDLKTFQDWEFDNEPCVSELDDDDVSSDYPRRSKGLTSSRNLYQLTDISDFMSGMIGVDEKFFVSSSSRPFDMDGSSSSQFFPGNSSWINVENATPDSGVEDIATPSSLIDSGEFSKDIHSVPSLKQLASDCIKKSKFCSSKADDILGGLRHTRNKLKLELPPSPSAFTVGKMFAIDNNNHELLPRDNPTFTTFGKSRFLVQHIDTPNESSNRNVSFEALPYKPLNHINKESQLVDSEKSNIIVPQKEVMKTDNFKIGIETVKGEASLLDSADEDSGIESSMLEKQNSKCNKF